MNTLFILQGPSGSGKTSAISSVMDNSIVSFTTRAMRDGEVEGKDYYFINRNQFDGLLMGNGIIEHSQYGGNFYGIAAHEFYSKLAQDHAYVIVDVHGGNLLRAKYPKTASIFLYTDIEHASLNLKLRGETDEFIAKRLSTYDWEMSNREYCDYVIRNVQGKLNDTVDILKSIVKSNT